MLNPKTREVLRTLTSVTDSFILESPRTTFVDEFKQVICSLNTEILDENFENPIVINNMSNFLSTIDLIENPEITITNRIIDIKNEKSEAKYLTSDINSIDKVKYSIIETTKKYDAVLNFKLSKEVLGTIKQAVQIFKSNDTLFFKKENDNFSIVLGVNETFDMATNEFSIKIPEFESTKDFEVKVPVQSILKLPNIDYNFEMKYNESKDAYRVYLSNVLLEIVISTIR